MRARFLVGLIVGAIGLVGVAIASLAGAGCGYLGTSEAQGVPDPTSAHRDPQ